jgi:ribosomal RNA-processing protein 8
MNFLQHKQSRDDNLKARIKKRSNIIKEAEKKTEIEDKLLSSKFRILNEKLYTISSEKAYDYFQNNPEDFEIYHKGFDLQAAKWPINPLDLIIKELLKPKYKKKVIVDMGCGEARLAKTLIGQNKSIEVHSFDLHKQNEFVTVCDIKNTPLEKSKADICVFCLSLMGINFDEFIKEAKRILKNNGILIVAEIVSRIVSMERFLNIFVNFGFEILKRKSIKGYFILLVFQLKDKEENGKIKQKINNTEILKPCIYKKR